MTDLHCDDFTLFSSYKFCEIWAKAIGGHSYLVDSNRNIGGIYKLDRFGIKQYEFGPNGLYWGTTEFSHTISQCLFEKVNKITNYWNCLSLKINFRYDSEQNLKLAKELVNTNSIQSSFTHVLELEGISIDNYLTSTAKGVTRRQIRAGINAGIEVIPLISKSDLEKHNLLYSAWARIKNIKPKPRSLFEMLATNLPESIMFLGAFRDERLLASILVFREKTEWFYWHGIRDFQEDRYFSIDVLIHHAIKAAIENGVLFFNMGNSGGISSLEQFKERWGSRKRMVWQLEWKHPVWSRVINLRKAVRRISQL